MKPMVALLGCQNVGKSTLFNRLTRASHALTANFPGLTRDRHYGLCKLSAHPFWVVDTGGVYTEKDEISQQVAHQLTQAMDGADVLLLMMDGKGGANSFDEALLQRVRRTGKPWMLLINKIDGIDTNSVQAEFAKFGASDTYMVSATHGTGVKPLLVGLSNMLKQLPRSETPSQEGIPLAIFGRPGTGKSTLVNSLLGEQRMVVSAEMGTTRDSIRVPCRLYGRDYVLVDTAGMRRRRMLRPLVEKFSVSKTLDALKDVPLAILVLDATQGWVSQDGRSLSTALELGCAVVIAANKWDMLDKDQARQARADIKEGLCFAQHVPCVEISAKHKTAVKKLFDKLSHVYTMASQPVSTAKVNQILLDAIRKQEPPMSGGRRVKLRYAHSGGNLPTVIVIHGNRAESVAANYRSYLERFYREALNLEGVPLKLVFKNSKNPYQTTSQES